MDRSIVPRHKVCRTFYNSFYALRLQVRLRGQSIELIYGRTNPQLSCKTFPTTSFAPVLQELFQVFSQYGVTNFGRCWSDPLPIVEVEFDDLDFSVKSLLESFEEIEPLVWRVFHDAFKSECLSSGKQPKQYGNGHRSGSPQQSMSCSIELLFFTPNHYRREVDILPVTLANYGHMEKQMESSLVFDFPSAIQQYHKREPPLVKEQIDTAVLHTDLVEVTSWFHLGLLLLVQEGQLLNILFSSRQVASCRVQLIEQWLMRERVRQDKQLLSKIIAAVLAAGRKSIATCLSKKYGIAMNEEKMLSTTVGIPPAIESLLTDPEIDDMKEDLEEKDHQLMEKQKTLEQYTKEQVMLKLSCAGLRKSLQQISEEVRDKIAEVKTKEKDRDISQKEAVSLEVFRELLEREVDSLDSELEGASFFVTRNINERLEQNQRQLRNVAEMLSRRRSHVSDLAEQLKTAEGALRVAKERVVQLNEEWFQESSKIVSKSQQMHQLKRVMDQIKGRVMVRAGGIDQLLQQKMAARNKPRPPVFQLQISVTKESIESKEQELNRLIKQEEKAANKTTALQSTTADKEKTVNQLLLKIKQQNNGVGNNRISGTNQTKEEEDQNDSSNESQLLEYLELLEELADLKERLLEAKEEKWELERRISAVKSECAYQKENLSVMEAEMGDSEPGNNGTADGERESSLVECVLTAGEVGEVEIGHPVQFIIPLEEKTKLNPRKHTFTAELKASSDNSVIAISVGYKATKPPTLTAICQPTVRGRHQLHVKANNKTLIKDSPFAVFVKYHPNLITGEPVKVINGFSYPYGITTATNSSHLIVTDCRKQQVVVIERDTQRKVMTIGNQAMNCKIKLPNGVTVDKAGNIYISDSGSHNIHKFSPEGTHITSVGSKGEKLLQFGFPYGIKFAPDNLSLLICDHNNFRIQVLGMDLKYKQSIYTGSPYDVTVDQNGVLYITDRCNHTIHVHDATKNGQSRTIASRGTEQGQLLEPRGICINQQGFLFVVEETTCRVSVFEKDGTFVTSFGREGKEAGEFNTPQGIAVDDDGFVYVCDMLNHRVQVF